MIEEARYFVLMAVLGLLAIITLSACTPIKIIMECTSRGIGCQ